MRLCPLLCPLSVKNRRCCQFVNSLAAGRVTDVTVTLSPSAQPCSHSIP